MKGNFLDLPTDCPTKERLGWTGDAQIFFHTRAYLMEHLRMSNKKAAKDNPCNEHAYEKGIHLGEWLKPEKFRDKIYGTQAKHPEECTAYLYLAMTTLAEIAGVLEETDYHKKCQKFADGARKAYEHLFVNTGTLDTDRQAKLVRPLALGLL